MLRLEAASVQYHYGAILGRCCETDSSSDGDHNGSQQLHTTVSTYCAYTTTHIHTRLKRDTKLM
jgi:hypothetical protein